MPSESSRLIARWPGSNVAESTWLFDTALIASEVVSFWVLWLFGISVWLASHTSRTITMSGKNALRKKRFTGILKSD